MIYLELALIAYMMYVIHFTLTKNGYDRFFWYQINTAVVIPVSLIIAGISPSINVLCAMLLILVIGKILNQIYFMRKTNIFKERILPIVRNPKMADKDTIANLRIWHALYVQRMTIEPDWTVILDKFYQVYHIEDKYPNFSRKDIENALNELV